MNKSAQLTKKPKIEITSTWENGYYMYHLYVNNDHKETFWCYDTALTRADELMVRYQRGENIC